MAKNLYKSLESGEEIKFKNVDYSNLVIKQRLRKTFEEQEKVIRDAECTIYEMSQVCFPQFHPFYKK